jgi:hypothetical protein
MTLGIRVLIIGIGALNLGIKVTYNRKKGTDILRGRLAPPATVMHTPPAVTLT